MFFFFAKANLSRAFKKIKEWKDNLEILKSSGNIAGFQDSACFFFIIYRSCITGTDRCQFKALHYVARWFRAMHFQKRPGSFLFNSLFVGNLLCNCIVVTYIHTKLWSNTLNSLCNMFKTNFQWNFESIGSSNICKCRAEFDVNQKTFCL